MSILQDYYASKNYFYMISNYILLYGPWNF